MPRLNRFARCALAGALLAWTPAALADAPTHEVKAAGGSKVAVGGKGVASLTINGKNGWHISTEAPMSLKLTPDPGVTLPKAKLGRADLAAGSADSARFEFGFTASEAGKKAIQGEAKFVVCQETACKPITEKVTFAVEVAPAK